MPAFYYEAIDNRGHSKQGSHEADLVKDVEKWLLTQHLTPVSIIAAGEHAQVAQSTDATISFLEKWHGITLEDHILFCRQCATLLAAGVDMLRTLTILGKQISNPLLREVVSKISTEIEQGESLGEAFENHPKVFTVLYRNIIKVGEESGNLDTSFSYMADLLENEKEIRERIKAATRYPKIVVVALFSATFFLMSYVVPKFVTLFTNAKIALPFATRLLIAISNFCANYNVLIIGMVVGLVLLYRMGLQYREVVHLRDSITIRLPVFGALYTKIYMARFSRVFAVLTRSGIDIIKTLALSSAALENLILRDQLAEISAEVEEGVAFDDAMSRQALFPEMVTQMVSVGVESGRIDEMMDKVADYYDMETNYTIKNLATLIEPLLLVFMGIMVGFIALAIFTPMWSMMEVMKGG
ncbi:MAG: type II secretion system F family protein [Proteobacteria bacterium]|nr:type II secretion system F family protein [Pseudomonadota bacterium]MBU1640237.1 type II secretion system F family protein [Pseudomonadota bacterium]